MIEFTSADKPLSGKLVYNTEDFSFDTIDQEMHGATSVVINDIQIEITIDNMAIAIWGMCPHVTWRSGHVVKPLSKIGKIWLKGEFTPGISIRVTPLGKYWPVTYDSSSGWLHVGQHFRYFHQAIEFLDGCIVTVHDGEVTGLWLRPIYQH